MSLERRLAEAQAARPRALKQARGGYLWHEFGDVHLLLS
jgi:hypothetical protein